MIDPIEIDNESPESIYELELSIEKEHHILENKLKKCDAIISKGYEILEQYENKFMAWEEKIRSEITLYDLEKLKYEKEKELLDIDRLIHLENKNIFEKSVERFRKYRRGNITYV